MLSIFKKDFIYTEKYQKELRIFVIYENLWEKVVKDE